MATIAIPDDAPNIEILETLEDVTLAKLENGDNDNSVVRSLGIGTLVITSRQVSWTSPTIDNVEFRSSDLIMHALSREGNPPDFERPCIYCQVDEGLGLELYFAPLDPHDLERCFRAFSQTCMMNPPEEESEMPEDTPGNFNGFYGEVGEDVLVGLEEPDEGQDEESVARENMLAHLDSILQVPPHLEVTASESTQFADAQPNADGP